MEQDVNKLIKGKRIGYNIQTNIHQVSELFILLLYDTPGGSTIYLLSILNFTATCTLESEIVIQLHIKIILTSNIL